MFSISSAQTSDNTEGYNASIPIPDAPTLIIPAIPTIPTIPTVPAVPKAPTGGVSHASHVPVHIPLRMPEPRAGMSASRRSFVQFMQAEAARAMVQHRYLAATLDEADPATVDCTNFRRVLDVGCDTGGWAMEMARRNPSVWVLGIDGSECAIRQAQAMALKEELANVEFRACEIGELAGTGYARRHFNLIHLQCMVGDIEAARLPDLAHHLVDLCRHQGRIVWTEVELPSSNSQPCEYFTGLVIHALHLGGRAIGPSWTPRLTPQLLVHLQHQNCRIEQDTAHTLEISARTDLGKHYIRHMRQFGRQMRPFVLETGATTGKEFDAAFARALRDIQSPLFCAVCFVRTIVAVCEKFEELAEGYW